MRVASGYIFATAILLVASSFLFARAQGTGTPEKPKSRSDWPTERVIVIGKRGSVRDWLVNHTFRGTEGFADGSAPADVGSRFEYYFQIYYMADGRLEARYQRPASRVPHGPIEALGFVETGKWRINDEGDVCQSIPSVGYGVELCYWVDRRGDRMAMYYTSCGAFNRCYVGRLGPEGEIVPGRAFTR
jgi:hypothetical protein